MGGGLGRGARRPPDPRGPSAAGAPHAHPAGATLPRSDPRAPPRPTLRAQGYDVALDFQGLWKSAVWSRAVRRARACRLVAALAARAAVRGPRAASGRSCRPRPPTSSTRTWPSCARSGSTPWADASSRLPRPAREAEAVDRGLAQAGVPAASCVVLNPGEAGPRSSGRRSRSAPWPARLRDRGLRPLVSWGPGEDGLADRVVAASGRRRRSLRSRPPCPGFVELARRARLVVAADTGPLHLACAVGTPVVGLFGPTDPARNGPFAAEDVVLRAPAARAPGATASACRRPRMAEIAVGRRSWPRPSAGSASPAGREPLPSRLPGPRRLRGRGPGPLARAAQRPLAPAVPAARARGRGAAHLGLGPHREDAAAGHRRPVRAHAQPALPGQRPAGPRVRRGLRQLLGGPGRRRLPPGLLPLGDAGGGQLPPPDVPARSTADGRATCRSSFRGSTPRARADALLVGPRRAPTASGAPPRPSPSCVALLWARAPLR